jgi:hypothetical protein
MMLKTQQFIMKTILCTFQQQYQSEVNHDLVLMAFGYNKHYKTPVSLHFIGD